MSDIADTVCDAASIASEVGSDTIAMETDEDEQSRASADSDFDEITSDDDRENARGIVDFLCQRGRDMEMDEQEGESETQVLDLAALRHENALARWIQRQRAKYTQGRVSRTCVEKLQTLPEWRWPL